MYTYVYINIHIYIYIHMYICIYRVGIKYNDSVLQAVCQHRFQTPKVILVATHARVGLTPVWGDAA